MVELYLTHDRPPRGWDTILTGRYIGEGFDDARLDALFLAMPVSWKGTLVQYTGRLHRRHVRKTQVRIFDYVARAVPTLARMFEKRLRAYRAIGYVPDETLAGCAAPAAATVTPNTPASVKGGMGLRLVRTEISSSRSTEVREVRPCDR